MRDDFLLLCGTASRLLGTRIAQLLDRCPGVCAVERFQDGEVNVHLDEPVRGGEVYIVQSTCPPVDENLIELLAMTDAYRRAAVSELRYLPTISSNSLSTNARMVWLRTLPRAARSVSICSTFVSSLALSQSPSTTWLRDCRLERR